MARTQAGRRAERYARAAAPGERALPLPRAVGRTLAARAAQRGDAILRLQRGRRRSARPPAPRSHTLHPSTNMNV